MTTRHQARMRRFLKAGLYVVTSREASAGRETIAIVRAVLAAGVTLIQLREKKLGKRDLIALAREIRRLTDEAGALLLINDHADVALAVGADGVHLGQDDFPVSEARKLRPDWIIGASTHTEAEAVAAEEAGASYVNIGPLFPTSTKKAKTSSLGMDGLRRISARVSVPFTVMGGIQERHIPDLLAAGARTVAVVSAVTAAPNPENAARALLAALRRRTS